MKDGRLNAAPNFTVSQNAIKFPINGFTHTHCESGRRKERERLNVEMGKKRGGEERSKREGRGWRTNCKEDNSTNIFGSQKAGMRRVPCLRLEKAQSQGKQRGKLPSNLLKGVAAGTELCRDAGGGGEAVETPNKKHC